ncbi:hypothetical protein [Actinophytocola sp.]|uniref:hypothetical protein n=1 Tax=Actinophytocola sp. TaxID=1872138 RepID=UPI0025C64707|nr:hypothetical protein [Actinophytocola sp.]
MNWTHEFVRTEMDYRVERALGDVRRGTTLEHLRAARESHPSWWRRVRVQHRTTNDAA